MNTEICNALSNYIQTLYKLNQKLIKLCGTDVIDKFEYSNKEILDIIQDIPRLIPYEYSKKNDKLELEDRDGLLEYKKKIEYLENDYKEILKNHYDFLDNVRKIRNKCEHKMHGIKLKSSGSGTTSLFDFEFDVFSDETKKFESINVVAVEFIMLFKALNKLFSKIIKDIVKYSYKSGKEDHPYYRRLSRFDFEDFNKIYDSDLLRTIGELMIDF